MFNHYAPREFALMLEFKGLRYRERYCGSIGPILHHAGLIGSENLHALDTLVEL